MGTPPTELKDRWTLLRLSVLLLGAALVFAVVGDAPHTLLVTGLGLTGSLLFRQPLARNTRTFVYAGVTVLAVTVLEDQVFPVDANRFFLMPAQLYAPAIIFLGVAATYFDQRDTNLTAVVALALIGTMLAGNTVAPATANPRFPLSDGLLRHMHLFFGIVVGVQMLAMLPLLPAVDRRCPTENGPRRYRRRRVVLLAACLVAAAALVIGLRRTALYYERQMQQTFARMLDRYMARQFARQVFSQDVDLWRTVPLRRRADTTVVLRARSSAPPDYLRGWAFAAYSRGRWANPSWGVSLPVTEPGGRYAFRVFRRRALPPNSGLRAPPSALDSVKIDVFPTPEFRSNVLLCPGTAREFELIAQGLTDDQDGVLTPRDWDPRAGYTVSCPGFESSRAYADPPLRTQPADDYLTVPAPIRAELNEVAAEVFPPVPGPVGARERITQVLRHLHDRFSYSLDVRMSPEVDPVLQFLTIHRRGHCELFATAAVLLLRTQGVPARYVTGFVCTERHPAGTHWVARLRDAHAWAEAYVAEEGRWILVEATPPAGVPAHADGFDPAAAAWDQFKFRWQDLLALVKRGYVAEAIVGALTGLGKALWWVVNHPVRGPLVFLTLFLAVRHLRRRGARPAAHDRLLPPPRAELRHCLVRVEKHLRRLGVARPPSATLREFARAVAATPGIRNVDAFLELLREYEQLRYQPEPPSTDTVRRFAEKVRRQIAAGAR